MEHWEETVAPWAYKGFNPISVFSFLDNPLTDASVDERTTDFKPSDWYQGERNQHGQSDGRGFLLVEGYWPVVAHFLDD